MRNQLQVKILLKLRVAYKIYKMTRYQFHNHRQQLQQQVSDAETYQKQKHTQKIYCMAIELLFWSFIWMYSRNSW